VLEQQWFNLVAESSRKSMNTLYTSPQIRHFNNRINMNQTLYFLRHGETDASQIDRYCGNIDPDLTLAGHQMANDFASAYKSFPWSAVFSSPLRRAVMTATPLCEAAGLKIHLEEGLKEIAYGAWEGKTREEVSREFHDDYIRWAADPEYNAPTGGEKGVQIAQRSSHVLDKINQDFGPGNILIVSHKATIRIMLCFLLGIDIGRYRDRFNLPVASLSVVERTSRGPLLHLFGDRSHLKTAE
jgi:probable phosphoglycerate mutase